MSITTRGARYGAPSQDITDKADKFDAPTILVNCLAHCPNCTELYPFLDDDFKAWLASQGYALYVNKDDATSTANYYKYGKPTRTGSTTPQFYAVNGAKVAGDSPVRRGAWTAEELRQLVGRLIAKVK